MGERSAAHRCAVCPAASQPAPARAGTRPNAALLSTAASSQATHLTMILVLQKVSAAVSANRPRPSSRPTRLTACGSATMPAPTAVTTMLAMPPAVPQRPAAHGGEGSGGEGSGECASSASSGCSTSSAGSRPSSTTSTRRGGMLGGRRLPHSRTCKLWFSWGLRWQAAELRACRGGRWDVGELHRSRREGGSSKEERCCGTGSRDSTRSAVSRLRPIIALLLLAVLHSRSGQLEHRQRSLSALPVSALAAAAPDGPEQVPLPARRGQGSPAAQQEPVPQPQAAG